MASSVDQLPDTRATAQAALYSPDVEHGPAHGVGIGDRAMCQMSRMNGSLRESRFFTGVVSSITGPGGAWTLLHLDSPVGADYASSFGAFPFEFATVTLDNDPTHTRILCATSVSVPTSSIVHCRENVGPFLDPTTSLADTLRFLWRNLVFRRVKMVQGGPCSDPATVSLSLKRNDRGRWDTAPHRTTKRGMVSLAQNASQRETQRVILRSYHGYTTSHALAWNDPYGHSSIAFSSDGRRLMDIGLVASTCTMMSTNFVSVHGVAEPPMAEDLICGEVELPDGRKPRMRRWFTCSEEFYRLWTWLFTPPLGLTFEADTEGGALGPKFRHLPFDDLAKLKPLRVGFASRYPSELMSAEITALHADHGSVFTQSTPDPNLTVCSPHVYQVLYWMMANPDRPMPYRWLNSGSGVERMITELPRQLHWAIPCRAVKDLMYKPPRQRIVIDLPDSAPTPIEAEEQHRTRGAIAS